MLFVATLVLTLCLVGIALWCFLRFAPPVYRPDKDNVLTLLELVVSGQATESDWNVFVAVPLRHSTELMDVQRRCIEIAETEYIGAGHRLFTARGIEEIARLLEELKRRQCL